MGREDDGAGESRSAVSTASRIRRSRWWAASWRGGPHARSTALRSPPASAVGSATARSPSGPGPRTGCGRGKGGSRRGGDGLLRGLRRGRRGGAATGRPLRGWRTGLPALTHLVDDGDADAGAPPKPTGRWRQFPGERREKGRLSRAVGPEQGHHLPGRDAQINAAQGLRGRGRAGGLVRRGQERARVAEVAEEAAEGARMARRRSDGSARSVPGPPGGRRGARPAARPGRWPGPQRHPGTPRGPGTAAPGGTGASARRRAGRRAPSGPAASAAGTSPRVGRGALRRRARGRWTDRANTRLGAAWRF